MRRAARWVGRVAVLWVAYTLGHWVGWGKHRDDPPADELDDEWRDW